jgi:mono/diheme cytochrome c family protein
MKSQTPLLLIAAFSLAPSWLRPAQTPERPRLPPRELYAQACSLCHGPDGRGKTWAGEVPVPDFSDCLGNTAEPSEHWETIVARGGKARGLSSTMPAFGEALTPEEIRGLVQYLRTFCADARAYPPGDLNFRRPLETGKAYPEQEVVLKPESAQFEESGGTGMEVTFENRLGPRFQYEVTLPFLFDTAQAPAQSGIGDLEIEGKQVLTFDLDRMQILSAGLGLTLPTGSREKGLGDGVTVLSPFAAYGKAWGRTILQTRIGAELSTDTDRRSSELFFQAALSQALGPPRVAWVPAVEFLGTHDFTTGEDEWAAVLEVSKALTRLGHLIGSVGVRLPMTESEEKYRVVAYLLWDFGDGPFWKGW